MKKTKWFLIATIAIIAALSSCKKDVRLPQTAVTANISPADELRISVKNKLKALMPSNVYSDFKWDSGIVESFDANHLSDLLQVNSKTDKNKSLFYSILDKEQMFIVIRDLHLNNKNQFDGTILISTISDVPIKKFTIKNNYPIKVKVFTGEGNVSNSASKNGGISAGNVSLSVLPTPIDPSCPDCTLPPVVVSTEEKDDPSLWSMFYTYGGGTGGNYMSGISTGGGTVSGGGGGSGGSGYGSGGYYPSPYYDKYGADGQSTTIVDPFTDINPNFYNKKSNKFTENKFKKIAHYPGDRDIWQIIDSKSFTAFTVRITFALSNTGNTKGHLITDGTEVLITGVHLGTYVMDKIQIPNDQYGNDGHGNITSMTFTINGVFNYGVFSAKEDIDVSVQDLLTVSPYANVYYYNNLLPL